LINVVSSPSRRAGDPHGQLDDLDAPILVRRGAAHQPLRLEPIDQAGDVRRVAAQAVGELPHRDRLVGFEQAQHVALRRRQLELGGQRRDLRVLGERELDEQLPGVAGVRIVTLDGHDDTSVSPTQPVAVKLSRSIFDIINY